MKRHKHSLSHYRLLTCDMGELVPVSCIDVLPGDSIQQATSALIRVSPLLAPVMHPVSVRIHHWFVPHRLCWTGWEEFITGGPDGIGGSSGAYPTITGTFAAGAVGDYLGVPAGVANAVVSALPFRAYGLIYNEFYRDQDLITKRVVSTASGPDTTTAVTLAKVAWEKDYFTASRPWTQKGPAVTVPIAGQAPVSGLGANAGSFGTGTSFIDTVGSKPGTVPTLNTGLLMAGQAAGAISTSNKPQVFAELGSATGASITDVRRAFAIQRYQEARALYGSRYTEYLRYLGVRSSDARLQRPEYLGGGKQTIAFSEVLQTGPAAGGTGVGDLKGHGISAMRSRRYRRFFEEHGYIISLMSVRPRSMYVNGLHRSFIRRTKEDYWQKELETIGQQALQLQEVYLQGTAADDDTFGYGDRYSEYRHQPSFVSGDFRTTLDFWHLGRKFAAPPTLNQSFVECDPSKRINAVTTNDVLWVMINNSIQARRMVARTSVGRVI